MTPEQFRRIETLYDAAARLDPPERERFIHEHCAGDEEVRRALIAAFRDDRSGLTEVVEHAAAIALEGETVGGLARPASVEHKRIGRYHVLGRLGRGAMGTVYRARDPHIGRIVAIKVFSSGDEELRARFHQEVRAAGTLSQQHIVTIHDFGLEGDRPFIVMEYVNGRSLSDLMRARVVLSLAEKLRLMQQLCSALDYAHTRGVVHRDIKPANLMLDEHGDVKVVDFGIAHIGGAELTRTGDVLGTLQYMSPEQIEGKPVDQRADIFAVGTVLYELLSSARAFRGDTPSQVIHSTLYERPLPLVELCPGLDPVLDRIVMRALEKNPADRYPSIRHLAADLERVDAAERAPVAAKVGSGVAWKALVAVAIVLAAGSWLLFSGRTTAPAPKEGTDVTLVQPVSTDVAPPPAVPVPREEVQADGPIAGAIGPTVKHPPPPKDAPPEKSLLEQADSLLASNPTPDGQLKAAGMLQTACTSGDATACLRGGLLYRDNGVVRNLPISARLLEAACDARLLEACNHLGFEYARGIGVAKDEVKASQLFDRACDGGEAPACTNLGRAYQQGRGVARDLLKAREEFKKACDGGGLIGCHELGVMLLQGQGGTRDEAQAIGLFQRACDGFVPPGCGFLGTAYLRGTAVPKDEARAALLFQRACDRGGLPSCVSLATLYSGGQGVEKDLARATALLERACDGDNADACQRLAQVFERGIGVERNQERAAELSRRAARIVGSQRNPAP